MISEQHAYILAMFMLGNITGWYLRGISDRIKKSKQREQEQN